MNDYQSAMQIEGVVLYSGDSFGKPFLLVVDSVRYQHFPASVCLCSLCDSDQHDDDFSWG